LSRAEALSRPHIFSAWFGIESRDSGGGYGVDRKNEDNKNPPEGILLEGLEIR
jgi:hypothetical protein